MCSVPVRIGDGGSSPLLPPATAAWGGHRGGECIQQLADDGQHGVQSSSTSTHQPPTKVTPAPSRPSPGNSSTSAAPTPFDLVRPGEKRLYVKKPRLSPFKAEDILLALRTIESVMVAQKMDKMKGQAAVTLEAWLRGLLARRTLRTRLSPTSNSGV